jgi:hypothetical protein
MCSTGSFHCGDPRKRSDYLLFLLEQTLLIDDHLANLKVVPDSDITFCFMGTICYLAVDFEKSFVVVVLIISLLMHELCNLCLDVNLIKSILLYLNIVWREAFGFVGIAFYLIVAYT